MTNDIKTRFKSVCPLKLQDLPSNWSAGGQKLHYCPLAVTRLKAIRIARAEGRVLTQEEEDNLPGCPWSIKSQMSGYCWFIYEATSLSENQTSEVEMAALLDIPIEQVKIALNSALSKIQSDPSFAETKSNIKDTLDSESRLSLEDEYVYFE